MLLTTSTGQGLISAMTNHLDPLYRFVRPSVRFSINNALCIEKVISITKSSTSCIADLHSSVDSKTHLLASNKSIYILHFCYTHGSKNTLYIKNLNRRNSSNHSNKPSKENQNPIHKFFGY